MGAHDDETSTYFRCGIPDILIDGPDADQGCHAYRAVPFACPFNFQVEFSARFFDMALLIHHVYDEYRSACLGSNGHGMVEGAVRHLGEVRGDQDLASRMAHGLIPLQEE